MTIKLTLDIMLVRHRVKSKDLAKHLGITEQNMSIVRTGKNKSMTFEMMEKICRYLNCTPNDLFELEKEL